MAEPFRGTINVDTRDLKPDWAEFEPPKAPEGAPNHRIAVDVSGDSYVDLERQAEMLIRSQ